MYKVVVEGTEGHFAVPRGIGMKRYSKVVYILYIIYTAARSGDKLMRIKRADGSR